SRAGPAVERRVRQPAAARERDRHPRVPGPGRGAPRHRHHGRQQRERDQVASDRGRLRRALGGHRIGHLEGAAGSGRPEGGPRGSRPEGRRSTLRQLNHSGGAVIRPPHLHPAAGAQSHMNITSLEIESQPEVWRRSLELLDDATRVLTRRGERVLVIGCGTSAFVAESFALLRETAGFGETDAAYASEPRPWRPYDAVIGITRSGTTTEVLQALRALPEGVRTVVVTGVADSPAAELADEVLVLDFADENSVVQTRFPTTFLFLARAAFGEDVSALPELAEQAIAAGPPEAPEGFDHVVYLGRGWTYGLAQEAALKIREAAQAWAESYPLLDFRHGPLAVAHPG